MGSYVPREGVEAIQFTGGNASEVYEFIGYDGYHRLIPGDTVRRAEKEGVIRGELNIPIEVSDWVVKNPEPRYKRDGIRSWRNYTVYQNAAFHATYQPAPTQHAVATTTLDWFKYANARPTVNAEVLVSTPNQPNPQKYTYTVDTKTWIGQWSGNQPRQAQPQDLWCYTPPPPTEENDQLLEAATNIAKATWTFKSDDKVTIHTTHQDRNKLIAALTAMGRKP